MILKLGESKLAEDTVAGMAMFPEIERERVRRLCFPALLSSFHFLALGFEGVCASCICFFFVCVYLVLCVWTYAGLPVYLFVHTHFHVFVSAG